MTKEYAIEMAEKKTKENGKIHYVIYSPDTYNHIFNGWGYKVVTTENLPMYEEEIFDVETLEALATYVSYTETQSDLS